MPIIQRLVKRVTSLWLCCPVWLALLLAGAVSCRTADRSRTPAAVDRGVPASALPSAESAASPLPTTPASAPALPLASTTSECPPAAVSCKAEAVPKRCVIDSYAGKHLALDAQWVVWDTSICAARHKFAALACSKSLLPSALGPMQCEADVTVNRCAPATGSCPKYSNPSVCATLPSSPTPATPSTPLHASGENLCLARTVLADRACRQHVNPLVLAGVECHADPTGGECGPAIKPCTATEKRRTVCTAKRLEGKPLAAPLEATGESGCAAKQELARKACALNKRPSTLDEVACMHGE